MVCCLLLFNFLIKNDWFVCSGIVVSGCTSTAAVLHVLYSQRNESVLKAIIGIYCGMMLAAILSKRF